MKPPRLDRSKPFGEIYPPTGVPGGTASFEQNHHYFNTHGKYLSSHEGYDPGADVGEKADAVIEQMKGMSDEAKAKIAAALGLAPAKTLGRAATQELDEEETDEELTGDDGETVQLTKPRGPLGGGDQQPERELIGGIDLIGWAMGKSSYPFFQVKKAYNDAYPDKPAGDQKAILDGMIVAGIIAPEEVNRG